MRDDDDGEAAAASCEWRRGVDDLAAVAVGVVERTTDLVMLALRATLSPGDGEGVVVLLLAVEDDDDAVPPRIDDVADVGGARIRLGAFAAPPPTPIGIRPVEDPVNIIFILFNKVQK
eukprot:PhM_4_TR5981/c0_g1_i1/m.99461